MVGVGRHPGGGIGGAALPLDPRLPVTASHSSGVTQGGLEIVVWVQEKSSDVWIRTSFLSLELPRELMRPLDMLTSILSAPS